MDEHAIARLIARRKPGHDLEQAFYKDPDIYERDLERIFLNSWQYAGHESQIPNPGDYFLFDFADESVIIVRAEDGAVHALLNVCRHRGSRVCLETSGCEKRLVCRYHGWTYGLDGALKGAPQMAEDFEPAQYGLKTIHLESLHGLIFVNFATNPVPFAKIEDDMVRCLAPYRLGEAKVAHQFSYPIAANWKLAVSNYCECYHCRPSHPEYSVGHALAVPEDKWAVTEAEANELAAQAGCSEIILDRSWEGELGVECEHERYPMVRGHVTGSRDGQLVAPLLGDLRNAIPVATDFKIGPTLFGLAYSDHVVLYRFTPDRIDHTTCEVVWLVNGDAEEGKDYTVEELTWLWHVTTLADQHIIEHNQEGVNSRFYEPGPFSKMETFADRFIRWYLAAVS